MRLLSATIRNYRIHREVSVDFSDSLTLIGGKNETGKSTLAEAIHRGLFLKATTGGKIQEAMQSSIHNGHPEVEISFEASGKRWDLKKVFSKTSGKTILTEEGGATLHQSDAEARIAELMQVEEGGSGVAAAKKSLAQWAHLWVWQGSGGDDPSEHAADQKDALLSRLKEQGGGAVMQSDLDGRVARHFQEEFDAIFTKGGQPKAGSDLYLANQEKEEAEEALNQASSALQKLRSAMTDFEEAEAVLASGEAQIADLKSQLEEAREKSKATIELRHRMDLEKRNQDTAEQNLESFQGAVKEISHLEARKFEILSRIEPEQKRLEALGKKKEEESSRLTTLSTKLEKAERSLDEAREKKELAEAWGHLLKNREEIAALDETLHAVEAKETARKKILEKLAALPAIDEATYQHLQDLDMAASEASAVLEAMSTGIEVIRADSAIHIGEKSLATGKEHVIHEETTISVGSDAELRITPGGGTDLERARSEAKQRREKKDAALRKHGIPDLEHARQVRSERQALEDEKRILDSELSKENPEERRQAKEKAQQEIIRYEAEVKRRSERSPDFGAPHSRSDARTLWESCRDQLESLEEGLQTARQETTAARTVLETTIEEIDRLQKAISTAEREQLELAALLQAKSEPLGDPETWEEKRASLTSAFEEANRKREASEKEWAALSPDTIEASISRFSRALEMRKAELEAAGQKRAVAQSVLSQDGSSDPVASLARAKARAESAQARHRSLWKRAEAIRLLRDRFAEEQQKLSDQFSQPLAEKVTSYLAQIFGPSARATVSVDDGVIGGWTMTRDQGTFEFADLSGGTREQVAAAVRLALAEILAADHGGTLPVVFDDAFTNSDPSRIQSLQSMLDLASCKGLQIILLTCTPEDYISLGARTIPLGESGRQSDD
ncbi:MAG: AAA family ATPase [Verrucomicrobiales bacterium]|nr:AAA family ATPase [Verrucomicrobiales bacterium]